MNKIEFKILKDRIIYVFSLIIASFLAFLWLYTIMVLLFIFE